MKIITKSDVTLNKRLATTNNYIFSFTFDLIVELTVVADILIASLNFSN